ncbi:hypothetical protein Lal_00013435 [Lupinus albus]|nr:hypothetical protein Lal_00013435 [Lupinus albus]
MAMNGSDGFKGATFKNRGKGKSIGFNAMYQHLSIISKGLVTAEKGGVNLEKVVNGFGVVY